MKLNVYKNQREIAKTVEVDAYDIMYGTIEDVFDVLDGIEDMDDTQAMMKVVQDNRKKLNDLILDIFDGTGLTREDLRHIKVKELVPFFMDLFEYVKDSFQSKN